MAVVLLTSATGAPGVTTTSLGLGLAWPRDVVVADADRDAGQAILAGFMQGQDTGGRGLTRLADYEAAANPAALLGECLPLLAASHFRRLLLPGFARPSSAALFEPVWPSFAQGLSKLDDLGCDVLVDGGRIRAGLPSGLLQVADQLLVVVRATLRSLAAARVHLDALAESVDSRRVAYGLVVIGAGHPYTTGEISEQFGWPVLATIAADPAAARVLSDGQPYRKYAKSAFQRSVTDAAQSLAARVRTQLMSWS